MRVTVRYHISSFYHLYHAPVLTYLFFLKNDFKIILYIYDLAGLILRLKI